jgi:putative DNA primase/helicase
MGIAEGVETAIAAAELYRMPVWSCISAGGISSFDPPPGTRRLVVFADNDENGVCERAASRLIDRLDGRLEVESRMPRAVGEDWNDVLVSRSRRRRA